MSENHHNCLQSCDDCPYHCAWGMQHPVRSRRTNYAPLLLWVGTCAVGVLVYVAWRTSAILAHVCAATPFWFQLSVEGTILAIGSAVARACLNKR